jgi:AcrR family transcriptional regulator
MLPMAPRRKRNTARIRRTQEERSAATRAALLDAAIDCLFDRGYAGTTTTEIADRAGVSRGAQLHHFPTKLSLVTSAVEHVITRRRSELRRIFDALPVDAERVSAGIDHLWSVVSGPTFFAWLELLVASRTDPELRASLAAIAARFDRESQELFAQYFAPTEEMKSFFAVGATLVLSAMEGLSAARIAIGDHPHIPRVLELLKMLAPLAIRTTQPKATRRKT